MSRPDPTQPLYVYMTQTGDWDTSTIPDGDLLSYVCQFPKEITGICFRAYACAFIRVCGTRSVYVSLLVKHSRIRFCFQYGELTSMLGRCMKALAITQILEIVKTLSCLFEKKSK